MPKTYNFYKEKKHRDFRDIVASCAAQYGSKTAFEVREDDGSIRKVSYNEFKELFYGLCTKFIDMGFLGKRIAVTGKNCLEWALSYICAATVGVVVPIDKELQSEDVNDFLESADCCAVVSDGERLENLKKVVTRSIEYIDFKNLRKMAASSVPADYKKVDEIEIGKDEMRILIFTSGTTGNSKGVCLSQNNICSNIYQTVQMFRVYDTDKVLSILPLHHTYECTLDFLLVFSKGCCISYCDGLTKVAKNMAEYSPSILVVVPALLKVLSKRIKKSVADGVPAKYKEAFETESLASAMKKLPWILRKIVCAKVRKTLGGKLRVFIVGAAELDTSLVEDFAALGIRTLQGYGLTECSPLLAGNSDFYLNPASTGKAIPGVELKIDNPNEEGVGEILARGDNIMLGYFNDEEATKSVMRDGWFCTGDLGMIDEEGDLFIKGRSKNVIVTENGKNIYPEELETRLSQYPEIGEVLVLSSEENGETAVKAKIFPNLDYLKEKLGRRPKDEEVEKAVQGAVKEVNKKIPGYKRIKIVEVLSNALEKTTTQKIKRFGKNVK
ncbi:MAG: AMP-binding protein [Clostridia bacterium]|nr:AMP-binding protein [Clostridia bacterium]